MLKISPLGTEIQADFYLEKLRLKVAFECEVLVLVRTESQKFSSKPVRFDPATSTAQIDQTIPTRFTLYPLARPVQMRVYLVRGGQQKEAGKIRLNVNQAIEQNRLAFQLPLEDCLTASRLDFSFTYQLATAPLEKKGTVSSRGLETDDPDLAALRERTKTDPAPDPDSSLGTSFQDYLNTSDATRLKGQSRTFGLLSVQSNVVRARSRSPYSKPVGNVQLTFGPGEGESKKGLNKSFNGEVSGSKAGFQSQQDTPLNTSQQAEAVHSEGPGPQRRMRPSEKGGETEGDERDGLLSIHIPVPTTLPLDFSDTEPGKTSQQPSPRGKDRAPFIPELQKPDAKTAFLSPGNPLASLDQRSPANSLKPNGRYDSYNRQAEREAEQRSLNDSVNRSVGEGQQVLDRLALKLQKDLNARVAEVNELKEQVAGLQSEVGILKDAEVEQKRLTEAYELTLAELEEARSDRQRLEDRLIELSSQRADERVIQDLRGALESSKGQLAQRERELADLHALKATETEALAAHLKSAEAQAIQLEKELIGRTTQGEAALKELEAQLAAQKAAFEAKDLELSQRDVELTTLRAKLKGQSAELESVRAQLAERPTHEDSPPGALDSKHLAFGSGSRFSSQDDGDFNQAELLGLKRDLIERDERLNHLERRNFELENELKVFKHMKHSVG